MATLIEEKPKTGIPLRRLLLAALGAVLVIVLFPVGVWLYQRAEDDRELREAAAEADRLDPGWRLADLEAARAVIPDADNAALTVLAAGPVTPRVAVPSLSKGPDEPAVNMGLLELSPAVALSETQAQQLRAALEKADAALKILRPLADQPRGRFPIAWAADFTSNNLSHLYEARKVAELLHLDATLKAHDGDIDGALMSVLAALNAGRAFGDEPLLVSQRFRLMCLNRALAALDRVLGQGQASPAVLEKVQQALAEEADVPLTLIALRGERASLHQTLIEFTEGRFDRRAWGLRNPALMSDSVMDMVDANKARDTHAATIRYMNELVEIAKRPAEEQKAAFAQKTKPPLDYPTLLMIFADGDPAKPPQNFLTCLARLRCAAATVAVERFRVQNGRWPADLNELTPGLLKAVPLDPMDGLPLRYVRLEDGVVVYSVGPDDTDDGGDLSRSIPPAVNKDVGFRLWDAERRRQPAPRPEDSPRQGGIPVVK